MTDQNYPGIVNAGMVDDPPSDRSQTPPTSKNQSLPICECATVWPGQGHPADCPVRQEIERLRIALGRAERVSAMVNALPVTTEELRRMRNAGKITFDKMVYLLTTCLIDMRGASVGSAVETTACPQAPIVRVVIENGKAAYTTIYAPGLPDGTHDLYCEPAAARSRTRVR